MRAVAALVFILLASFGAPETVALFLKDAVVRAFAESYMPFLVQTIKAIRFPDIDVPAAGTTVRLQGLSLKQLYVPADKITIQSQNGFIVVEATGLAAKATANYRMLGGFGNQGQIEVTFGGGKNNLVLKVVLDEQKKPALSVHSNKMELSGFNCDFSGSIMNGFISFFSNFFIKDEIRKGVEGGVSNAIKNFLESTGRDFLKRLPQILNLGEEVGFSVDYSPSTDLVWAEGVVFRTDAELFDSRVAARMPRPASLRPVSELAIPKSDSMATLVLHEEFFNQAVQSLMRTQELGFALEYSDVWTVMAVYGYTYTIWNNLALSIPAIDKLVATAEVEGLPVVRIQDSVNLSVRLKVSFTATIFDQKMSFDGISVAVEAQLEPRFESDSAVLLVVKHVQVEQFQADKNGSSKTITNDGLTSVLLTVVNAYLRKDNHFGIPIPLRPSIPGEIIFVQPQFGFIPEALVVRTDLKFNFKKAFGAAAPVVPPVLTPAGLVRI